MASKFYRTKDGPHYVLGHALEIGFTIMGIVAALFMRKACQMVKQRRQEKMNELYRAFSLEELREQLREQLREELRAMGDKAPTFKYML